MDLGELARNELTATCRFRRLNLPLATPHLERGTDERVDSSLIGPENSTARIRDNSPFVTSPGGMFLFDGGLLSMTPLPSPCSATRLVKLK